MPPILRMPQSKPQDSFQSISIQGLLWPYLRNSQSLWKIGCTVQNDYANGFGSSFNLIFPTFLTAGAFQSDALLVPEHCLFDHIHNQTKCWDFDQWNRTASTACQERGMKVKSFAMLLPCGIDVFSGVEFVCCPFSKNTKKGAGLELTFQKTLYFFSFTLDLLLYLSYHNVHTVPKVRILSKKPLF